MKLKSFCTIKQMVSKLKIPPTEWEEIFAQNQCPIKKCATELNRNFSKE
jgi:hypothetical protein